MNKDEKKTRKRQQTTDNRKQRYHMKFEQTNGYETKQNAMKRPGDTNNI